MDTFNVGDKVRSKVNSIYCGTYTVLEVYKTCLTVQADEPNRVMRGGKWIDEYYVYKGVRFSTVRKVSQQ